MGFGAIVTSGKQNRNFADELYASLVEIRVEQAIDQVTEFALLFEEDILNGEPMLFDRPEIAIGQMLSVIVLGADQARCLVRGPIVEVEHQARIGGPGSVLIVRGRDRRVELGRKAQRKSHAGDPSLVVNRLLREVFDDADVGSIRTGGTEDMQPVVRQSGSHLDFIANLARNNALNMWVSYSCQSSPLGNFTIREKAHVQGTPTAIAGGGLGGLAGAVGALTGGLALPFAAAATVLRVHVAAPEQPSVTEFGLRVEAERPSAAQAQSLSTSDLGDDSARGTSLQAPLVPLGRELGAVQGLSGQHEICLTVAGGVNEAQARQDALLTEASWFVHATASTSEHLLGTIVMPPDVVEVRGLGSSQSGNYQVHSVVHVITSTGHFMDLGLRRNSTGS
jgi:hypothetical protein